MQTHNAPSATPQMWPTQSTDTGGSPAARVFDAVKVNGRSEIEVRANVDMSCITLGSCRTTMLSAWKAKRHLGAFLVVLASDGYVVVAMQTDMETEKPCGDQPDRAFARNQFARNQFARNQFARNQ